MANINKNSMIFSDISININKYWDLIVYLSPI